MPNRILREGIVDSQAVNSLSWPAEVLYRRLMSVVDDYGRFDGRPSYIRCRLYPVGVERVRETEVTRWIAECVNAGLIALYTVDAKPYILFHKLGEPRAKHSKFPTPPENLDPQGGYGIGAHLQSDASICAQTRADVPYSLSPTLSPTPIDSLAGETPTSGGDVKNGKAKPPPRERKPRQPDPLFDAIAEVTASEPATAGSHIGKVAASMRRAEPPFTPEEVREFGRRFAELCTWAPRAGRLRPELGELQKHIGKVRATAPKQEKSIYDPQPGFDPMAGGAPMDFEAMRGKKR